MSLQRERIKDLSCHTEVYRPEGEKPLILSHTTIVSPNKIIDLLVPDVMAEDEKSFVYSCGFREGLDQMPRNISIANDVQTTFSFLSPQILYSIMNLHHDHHSLVCQRTEQILVVYFLENN